MKFAILAALFLSPVTVSVAADLNLGPLNSGPYHVCRGERDDRCSRDFGWPVGTYTHISCSSSQTDQQVANAICGGARGNIVYLKRGAPGNHCGYDWWETYCP